MARFVKGEVVVIPFPYSDLSGSKRRPAMVLSDLPGDDILLCQITSQQSQDQFATAITNADFVSGSLPIASFIRPARIFTADKSIIVRSSGIIKPQVVNQVTQIIIGLIK